MILAKELIDTLNKYSDKQMEFITKMKLSDTFIFGWNKKTNEIHFIKDASYTNITGAYDWINSKGEKLEGEHGDFMALITGTEGKIKLNDQQEHTRDHYQATYGYNVIRTCDNIDFLNKLENMNEEAKLMTWKGYPIEGIEMLPEDISIFFVDSYGHDHLFSPKTPVIALVMGDDPYQQKFVESNLSKFEDFKKNR